MGDSQGEMVLLGKREQVGQLENEYSNRIEKYEKIVKLLKYLTLELETFGNTSRMDENNIRPKIAITYIKFYKNCIEKLKNGDLTEEDCDEKLSLDYFLRECKTEEYKKSIKLKKEIVDLKDKLKHSRDSEKSDIKEAKRKNKEKIDNIRVRIIRNLESFEKKLNEYVVGVFSSLSKNQYTAYEDELKKETTYVVVPRRVLEKSNYALDILYFKDINDYLNKLYKEISNEKSNGKQFYSKLESFVNTEKIVDLSDKDYKYLTYFISAFWGALIFPFMSVNLVNGNGKLIFGNFIIFLLSVVVASIFSYKIGSTFKHLERDKFMFFDNLARYYFLIPFKPFLFLMKIEFVKNALEKLDNKFSFLNKVQRIEEFVYAIQSYEGVILMDEIESSGINGKRAVNKTILKAQQMVCPKCQKAGIASNLIGLSGKNGSYAVCELHSESHIFKVDPATLELEEITTYRDKKL